MDNTEFTKLLKELRVTKTQFSKHFNIPYQSVKNFSKKTYFAAIKLKKDGRLK